MNLLGRKILAVIAHTLIRHQMNGKSSFYKNFGKRLRRKEMTARAARRNDDEFHIAHAATFWGAKLVTADRGVRRANAKTKAIANAVPINDEPP